MRKRLTGALLAGILGLGVLSLGVSVTMVQDPVPVYAQNIGDNLSGSNSQSGDILSGGSITSDDLAVGNWIGKQRGMTGEQLNTASRTLSPLTSLVGYIIGGIVSLIFVGVFLITALDLLYISFPPVRNLLYKAGTDGTGAYTGGMPGGGYGRGMNGNMMGGAGGAPNGTNKPTQFISDEAVQCAALLGGSAQAQNGMGGMMGQPQQMPMKSVIGTYFKKRIGFMILLVISAIILTSSVIIGTGVNLAEWGLRIIDMLNGYIPK